MREGLQWIVVSSFGDPIMKWRPEVALSFWDEHHLHEAHEKLLVLIGPISGAEQHLIHGT
eukprot:scaffold311721_cov24-Tisochrysis_lutea.AAC.3